MVAYCGLVLLMLAYGCRSLSSIVAYGCISFLMCVKRCSLLLLVDYCCWLSLSVAYCCVSLVMVAYRGFCCLLLRVFLFRIDS